MDVDGMVTRLISVEGGGGHWPLLGWRHRVGRGRPDRSLGGGDSAARRRGGRCELVAAQVSEDAHVVWWNWLLSGALW